MRIERDRLCAHGGLVPPNLVCDNPVGRNIRRVLPDRLERLDMLDDEGGAEVEYAGLQVPRDRRAVVVRVLFEPVERAC